MHNQIMIDIETMGNRPGAAIVTIGACAFSYDTNDIGKTFYATINLKSCMQAGLHMDADTVMWWMSQSDAARKDLISKDAVTLKTALTAFSEFCVDVRNAAPLNKLNVWGNGAGFDITLLEAGFSAIKEACPWNFWEAKDVRTMVWLGEQKGFTPKRDMPFVGTAHNALADAIHQAKYCMAIKAVLDNKDIPAFQ